jgi:uncharacterized protein (TIGR00266 family)
MNYEIKGGNLPAVVCRLEQGEKLVTQSGGMSWMSPNMKMETSTNGGVGKAMGRMFTGESLFQNIYTAEGGNGMIALASKFPGSIMAVEVAPGKEFIVQKSGFLASEMGVTLSTHLNTKLGVGFVGGEGFILQRLSGNGTAFIEIDGAVETYDLKEGQQIVIDTGHLAAMSASCKVEVKKVGGIKNSLLGGEGFFHTVVTGPGKVYLQTMPISRFAGVIANYIPRNK